MKRLTVLFFAAALLVLILACADGSPNATPVPIRGVYETALTRDDELQGTAQAIMTEAAK